jgi:hypothetical protein
VFAIPKPVSQTSGVSADDSHPKSPTAFVVDYDDEGRIVGIEILDASKRTADPAALKQFSFEQA